MQNRDRNISLHFLRLSTSAASLWVKSRTYFVARGNFFWRFASTCTLLPKDAPQYRGNTDFHSPELDLQHSHLCWPLLPSHGHYYIWVHLRRCCRPIWQSQRNKKKKKLSTYLFWWSLHARPVGVLDIIHWSREKWLQGNCFAFWENVIMMNKTK